MVPVSVRNTVCAILYILRKEVAFEMPIAPEAYPGEAQNLDAALLVRNPWWSPPSMNQAACRAWRAGGAAQN